MADELIHPNPNSSMHGSLGEDEEYVLIEEEEEEELDGDMTVSNAPQQRVVEVSTTPVMVFDQNNALNNSDGL